MVIRILRYQDLIFHLDNFDAIFYPKSLVSPDINSLLNKFHIKSKNWSLSILIYKLNDFFVYLLSGLDGHRRDCDIKEV